MKNIKKLNKVSGGAETISETYVHQKTDQIKLAGSIGGNLNVVENQAVNTMPASVKAMYSIYNS